MSERRTIGGRRILSAGMLVVVPAVASVARGADIYFDTLAGDDGNDGASEATPKKTIEITAGSAAHVKRGSRFSGNLSLNGATLETYGCGPRVLIDGSLSLVNSSVEGLHVRPTQGSAINVQSGNSIRDCEADGSAGTSAAMGIVVLGENNRIIGNYVHDFSISQAGSTVNDSGGAEGIVVMGSNNEIAFNKVVNCQSVNTTLGGYEGGCYEIVNGKGAGETIHDVSFHHNYCEKSVGLFEGCSGNYSATAGGVMENHGIIENVTVSYNVSVDSMWLFLLQTVNTDFKNVIFANNTIVHTPKSAEYWEATGGHFQMALAYDTDTSTGTTIHADNEYFRQDGGFQSGTVAVRNNIFVDAVGSTRNTMFLVNLVDHGNNLFVPGDASVSFAFGGGSTPAFTLHDTERKLELAELALGDDYQLTKASAAAIDQGAVMSMSAGASLASAPPNAPIFAAVFSQDVARQAVPCGVAPDIGASEFCGGTTLVWPGPSDETSCPGTVGAPSTGGAAAGGGVGSAGTPAGGASAGGNGSAGATPNTSGTAGEGGTSSASGGASGAPAAGGSANANGAGAGGIAPANGGGPTAGSSAAVSTDDTASSQSEAVPGDAGGCSCRIGGDGARGFPAFAVAALVCAALAGMRRRAVSAGLRRIRPFVGQYQRNVLLWSKSTEVCRPASKRAVRSER